MKRLTLCIVAAAIALLSSSSLHAQDIPGDWQGTLQFGNGSSLRSVLRVTKNGSSGWNATLYSIDQGPEGMAANSVTIEGTDFKFSISAIHGSYEGKLTMDGTSISGTWTQYGSATPLVYHRATKETAWPLDSSPHAISFITVDKDIKLEVLDWGGAGRPLVFLAGGGNTAHVFDAFAPKFTGAYHVYGITRRGFGDSSAPVPANGNYSADRLADDVLTAIDSLKLNRPVIVGHSIGGEELSSIGSRHPEKVAGLIYLDAGYWYAYYDRSRGDVTLDSIDVRKKLEQVPLLGSPDARKLIDELLQTSLPQLEKELREYQKLLQALPAEMQESQQLADVPVATAAMIAGEQKFTDIRAPILAIFAITAIPGLRERSEQAANSFESGIPSARVVRLQNATHYVFQSNEADVIREMNAFLATLK